TRYWQQLLCHYFRAVGALICFTVDGTTPTATIAGACSHGSLYSSAVSITVTSTLQAIATEVGFTNSSVTSGVYTVPTTPPVAGLPAYTTVSGNGKTSLTIAITSPTPTAYICYTVDGSAPVSNDAGGCTHGNKLANGGQLTFTVTTVVQSLASAAGFTDSGVAMGVVLINNQPLPGPQPVTILLL